MQQSYEKSVDSIRREMSERIIYNDPTALLPRNKLRSLASSINSKQMEFSAKLMDPGLQWLSMRGIARIGGPAAE
jgi:hypothetical protein